MARLSKRVRAIRERVDTKTPYSFEQAVTLLKECALKGFEETLEVAVKLGIDARKSYKLVRGATVLPHGKGKSVRVAVFAVAEEAKEALEAGADIVGMEDLVESIKAGKIDFDVLIAQPATMRLVSQLGQILGPRGLMPNPKSGTVTDDIATAVKNTKKGQLQYRSDKGGIVHGAIGTLAFPPAELRDNLSSLLADLRRAKPAAAKGTYLRKITLSTTMGPGLDLNLAELDG